MTEHDNENVDENFPQKANKVLTTAVWMFIGFCAISLVFDIFLTRMLWTSCKMNCDNPVAMKNALLWRNVNYFLLLFYPFVLYCSWKQTWLLIVCMTLFIWHTFAIYVMGKFIKELGQTSQIEKFVTVIRIKEEDTA